MALPAYESLFQSEPLPPYSNDIEFRGKLLCKQELEEPHVPAFHRRWQRVNAELRGTTFVLYLSPRHSTPDGPSPTLVRRYTLQYADAGLAPDYKRRADVFRVRVEGEQLLFVAPGSNAAVQWVESLLAATAISQPLDQWSMPKYPGLPGRAVKIVGPSAKIGIGGRLMTELSWQARQREEWLLDIPSRPRKERWKEVFLGTSSAPSMPVARRNTMDSTSTCDSTITRRSASSAVTLSSGRSGGSCPCSSCWTGVGHGTPQTEDHESGSISGESDMCGPLTSIPESSRSCSRVLPKYSAWKGDYYVRRGRRMRVQPPKEISSVIQGFSWGQPEQWNNQLRGIPI